MVRREGVPGEPQVPRHQRHRIPHVPAQRRLCLVRPHVTGAMVIMLARALQSRPA